VSRDPIGYAAGDINLYRFVNNNPFNVLDPYGYSGVQINENTDFDLGIALYSGFGGRIGVNIDIDRRDCPCSDNQEVNYKYMISGQVGIGLGGEVGPFSLMVTGQQVQIGGELTAKVDCNGKTSGEGCVSLSPKLGMAFEANVIIGVQGDINATGDVKGCVNKDGNLYVKACGEVSLVPSANFLGLRESVRYIFAGGDKNCKILLGSE
jgi:hypothetical protein